MLKRAMNNNKPKFYILLYILYVAQLTQCKVALRRDDGDTNAKQANLVASDDSGTSDAETLDDVAADPTDAVKHPNFIAADPNAVNSEHPNLIAANPNAVNSEHPNLIAANPNVSSNEPQKSLKHRAVNPNDNGNEGSCWISLNEKNFFEKMDSLDKKYKDARDRYAKDVDIDHFDKRMLDAMKDTRAAAERTLQKFRGNPNIIPAGLNLGSYCMMKMPGSILFFYRLKLRNDTRFTVNYIHNDVKQFTLTMRLSLNDLHVVGQYERAITSREDASRLYYKPNNGEIEFLLKDVKYKVEGRYRLLQDRLHIEHIISEIPPMEILMRYTTDSAGRSTVVQPESLRDYLNRMQSDLDLWLKDYFNDFLMLYGFEEAKQNAEMQQYEDEKTVVLNDYADKVMEILNNRMRKVGSVLMMPDFRLTAANGMEIKLYDGSVRGVDSMYRRSVATGKRDSMMRFLNADIGFSGLKAEYRYDTYVKTGMPPVSGVFVLNADDIDAHMALQVVNYKPSTADLRISFLRHGKPESLTIEGPANRIVANFNHLLQHHIITLMSSTLIHHIRSMSSLTKCDPQLPTKESQKDSDEDRDIETEKTPKSDDDDDITVPTGPADNDDTTTMPQNSDDGPSPSDKDDDGPTSPDDDDNSPSQPHNADDVPENPDNDDDGPSQPDDNDEGPKKPDSDDDGPPSPGNDDDGPPQPDNADDGPIKPDNDHDGPIQPDDDDGPMKPDEDDDGPMKPDDEDGVMKPDDDDDGPMKPDDEDGVMKPDDDDDGPMKPDDDDEAMKPVDDDDGSMKPDIDDDGPMKPDDDNDGSMKPEIEDDGPMKPDDDDDGSIKPDDDDGPMKPDNDDDEPMKPDDDDGLMKPDDDDGLMKPDDDADGLMKPDNIDDGQIKPNNDDDGATHLDNDADYGFDRKESIELEIPYKPGSPMGGKYKIDHKDTFYMKKLIGGEVLSTNNDDLNARKQNSGNKTNSKVEDKKD